MIHVPKRPDVHVRLASIKFLFAHLFSSSLRSADILCGGSRASLPASFTRSHPDPQRWEPGSAGGPVSLEPAMRFELMTSSLPRMRSTPELRRRGDGKL